MAHLLIVELPGGNDDDLLQAALARGDSFVFLSWQLSHYRDRPSLASSLFQAAAMIDAEGLDFSELQQQVLRFHAEQPFDALLCLIDIRQIEVAQLGAALGLPFMKPQTARLLRDKFETRRHLQAVGLPQPEFRCAGSSADLHQAVESLGLPVLIKPTDGYGSQNIVVLREAIDLEPWLSPLDTMLPSDHDYGLGVRACDRLLVERFMQGQVIGCDVLTQGGRHRLLGIHEKLFFEPPSFAIRGGCFIPNLGQFPEVENYIFSALDAVGFDLGASHIELMLTAEGPRLIEINPRLVGAKIGRLVSLGLGFSIHEALIRLHLRASDRVLAGVTPRHAVSRWLTASRSGTLVDIRWPQQQDARIRHVDILRQAGDSVGPPYENADRLGCVMGVADSREEAEQAVEDYVAQFAVIVD